MTGVPTGYKHNWKYSNSLWNEKKIKKGLWKFKWSAIKRKKARSYGSFGKGTTGAWKIKGRQYIRKIGKGMYKTTMFGTKKPLKFNIKRPKKRKY